MFPVHAVAFEVLVFNSWLPKGKKEKNEGEEKGASLLNAMDSLQPEEGLATNGVDATMMAPTSLSAPL